MQRCLAILEADNPLQCGQKRINLNEPVFFIPEATFLRFLHGITSYLTLSDNEPILFFPFQQVRARLLLNRKNGDVLLA